MRKKILVAIFLSTCAPNLWADPSDRQVLDLNQRWNSALAGANDFNALAPFMSRPSLEEISSMDPKQQQTTFMMLKMTGAMGASKQWTVESHRKEKGFFLYKLVHQEKNSRGSTELPVAEEDGQLKVDFRRRK